MKKKIGIIVALLLAGCFVLAACAAPSPGESFKDKTVTIVLEENATTGYTWAVSVDNEAVLSLKSDKYYEESDGEVVGAGGVHEYVFQAQGPGTAVITFELGQQWDGGEKGTETKKYQVTVGDDGKIASVDPM
jgi:inhibitor of cysteine peptidase